MYKVGELKLHVGVRAGSSQENEEEREETICVKGPVGMSLAHVRKGTKNLT